MLWERVWDARDEILSLLLLGFGLVRLGMMAVSLVRHGHIGLGKRGLRAQGVRHNNQGLKALRQADGNAALAQFQQAAGLLHEAGDRRGEGLTLSNASLACEYLGAYRQMIAHAEQALALLGPPRPHGSGRGVVEPGPRPWLPRRVGCGPGELWTGAGPRHPPARSRHPAARVE
jgi:tetratricopeptide (TPR) repeat protein